MEEQSHTSRSCPHCGETFRVRIEKLTGGVACPHCQGEVWFEQQRSNLGRKILGIFILLLLLTAGGYYALKRTLVHAHLGDAVAQFELGQSYLGDRAASSERTSALRWIERSAKAGHGPGILAAGRMHRDGRETERDKLRAYKFFGLAEAGQEEFTEARYEMAMLHLNGMDSQIDHETTFQLLREAVEGNDNSDAEYELGKLYVAGLGTPKDPGKALELFARNADHHPGCAFQLARLHEDGEGTTRSYEKAGDFFHKTVELIEGEAEGGAVVRWQDELINSETSLYSIYNRGLGRPRNPAKALHWLRAAGEHGSIKAARLLHLSYETGTDVSKDFVQARYWLAKAAESDKTEDALKNWPAYARYLYLGIGGPKDVKKSNHFYERAATKGHAGSQFAIGYTYYFGEAVEVDQVKALEWFVKAARQGHVKAAYYAGSCFYYGRGAEKSYPQAFKYFMTAGNGGHATAQTFLGIMYRFGEGTKPDPLAAERWYQKAVEQKNVSAMANLGSLYLNDKKFSGSYSKAREGAALYQRAAEAGNTFAMYHLAMTTIKGRGVSKSTSSALKWLEKASGAGHLTARGLLKQFAEEKKRSGSSDRDVLASLVRTPKEEFAIGESAWKRRSYATAAVHFRRAAESGMDVAQFNLGHMYLAGQGVKRSSSNGKYWIGKAADQGLQPAVNYMRAMAQRDQRNKAAMVMGALLLGAAAEAMSRGGSMGGSERSTGFDPVNNETDALFEMRQRGAFARPK